MDLAPFGAVVLSGGRGRRLGGADKAALQLRGRSLLDRALDAVEGACGVVVVGEARSAPASVRFVVEEPRYAGPAAALLTGAAALECTPTPQTLAVLAVDMPEVSAATIDRLRVAASGRDGSVLTGPDGRRQFALVLDAARLGQIAPEADARRDLALWRLLAPLALVEVAATGGEHLDVDTWSDLDRLAGHDDD